MVLPMVMTAAKVNMCLELVVSKRITASQFKARCLALMDQVVGGIRMEIGQLRCCKGDRSIESHLPQAILSWPGPLRRQHAGE